MTSSLKSGFYFFKEKQINDRILKDVTGIAAKVSTTQFLAKLRNYVLREEAKQEGG